MLCLSSIALVLAVWVPGFSALMCAYYNRYQSHSKLATFVAGFTSGFVAMEVQPAQPLKQRVSIYMLNTAIETAYKLLASAGVVKMIPKGECLVFAVVCAVLSYINQHHKEQVPSLLQKPIAAVEGDPSCEKPVVFISQQADAKLKIPSQFAASPAGYVISGTVRALLLSAAVKFVGALIGLVKKALGKGAPAPAGSFLDRHGFSLFLVVGTTLYRVLRMCIGSRHHEQAKWTALLPGFVAGLSSFFWPSVTISQICLAQSLDAVWQILTSSGRIVSPRKGQSILFGLSTAVLFYASIFNKATVRPSTLGLLGRLSDGNFVNRPKLGKH